jgi:hypothetical protein
MFDRKKYPPDWKQISLAERAAAGNQCRWCKAPNGVVLDRATGGYWKWPEENEWRDKKGRYIGLYESSLLEMNEKGYNPYGKVRMWQSKCILTVAHLGVPKPDGSPGNKHDKQDCRPENLAALCQSCHLTYDVDEHKANRKKTLRARKRALQPELELI